VDLGVDVAAGVDAAVRVVTQVDGPAVRAGDVVEQTRAAAVGVPAGRHADATFPAAARGAVLGVVRTLVHAQALLVAQHREEVFVIGRPLLLGGRDNGILQRRDRRAGRPVDEERSRVLGNAVGAVVLLLRARDFQVAGERQTDVGENDETLLLLRHSFAFKS